MNFSNQRTEPAHLLFQQAIVEAFRLRDGGNPHWSDGLLHIVAHDQFAKLACHHQHSQYHLVLHWLENIFPQAARWMGVRELARLALDFLQNSDPAAADADVLAQRFVDALKPKRSNRHVAQLECLMRCGLAVWRLSCAGWRSDLAVLPHDREFALVTLIEHQQAEIVESTGPWSAYGLWRSVTEPTPPADDSEDQDAILFFRRDEFHVDAQMMNLVDLRKRLENQRV